MSYLTGGELWPRLDPITQKQICHACWNLLHDQCGNMYNDHGQIKCDHFYKIAKGKCSCKHECNCVHLSEAIYAEAERKALRDARRERRTTASKALAESPLRAVNGDWTPNKTRPHA
jgi:hypothetical protein